VDDLSLYVVFWMIGGFFGSRLLFVGSLINVSIVRDEMCEIFSAVILGETVNKLIWGINIVSCDWEFLLKNWD